MLCGCFCTVHIILAGIGALIIIPIFIYQAIKHYNERKAQLNRVYKLMDSLVQKEYDSRIFSDCTECPICMGDFED